MIPLPSEDFDSSESNQGNEKPATTSDESTRRGFNGLTPREWTQLSRNVWSDLSSRRHPRQLNHGAVYPVKLASRLVRLFSAPGDLVLDPFVGIGSTLVAAMHEERRSVGIELNPEFVDVAQKWLSEETTLVDARYIPKIHTGDVRDLAGLIDADSVQLTVTSPPYANFIRRSVEDRRRTHKQSRFVLANNSRATIYSDDSRDLGNLPYEQFLDACKEVLRDLLTVTLPGGYAVWVVKDYRLPPKQPYISFHSDLAGVAVSVGWLWHDLIVWDQNNQRSLVLLGYPSRFYSNQNCSFLVVLRRDVTK